MCGKVITDWPAIIFFSTRYLSSLNLGNSCNNQIFAISVNNNYVIFIIFTVAQSAPVPQSATYDVLISKITVVYDVDTNKAGLVACDQFITPISFSLGTNP